MYVSTENIRKSTICYQDIRHVEHIRKLDRSYHVSYRIFYVYFNDYVANYLYLKIVAR
jgi:hypothetical protein